MRPEPPLEPPIPPSPGKVPGSRNTNDDGNSEVPITSPKNGRSSPAPAESLGKRTTRAATTSASSSPLAHTSPKISAATSTAPATSMPIPAGFLYHGFGSKLSSGLDITGMASVGGGSGESVIVSLSHAAAHCSLIASSLAGSLKVGIRLRDLKLRQHVPPVPSRQPTRHAAAACSMGQAAVTSTGMPFSAQFPDRSSRAASSVSTFELTPGFVLAVRISMPSSS
jgi:hypothetical protein